VNTISAAREAPIRDAMRLGSAGVWDAAGHCLDLADLAGLGSPDEIAPEAYLKGARVALAVYQR